MSYRFAEFELDTARFELRAHGAPVSLEPKIFDVLAYLIRHRERVVSKSELLEKLWPGEFVSEAVLPKCVALARRALGDDGTAQRMIQTVHGRGYRFVAALEERAEVEPQPRPEATPFVGRGKAMAELRAGLEEAAAGRGRLLLLAGEPGVGKTRTAEELARQARARGARVLTARSYEGEGAPAFWPWVQILRGWLDEQGAAALAEDAGVGAADIAQILPELRHRLPDLPEPAASGPEEARFRLFDSTATLLIRGSRNRCGLLILDDLHWADAPSLLLLQFLAHELHESRLLVIGTYRDVDLRRTHPLSKVLGELLRARECRRIVLRGLERADIRRFIEETTGGACEEALVAAVYEMTEGNPFFMGEVVRLLVSEGRLAPAGEEGSWSIELPQGVREAVGRRLDALSRDCNRVLSLASVIGRDFELRALQASAQLPAERLLEVLDEARGARIITQADPGRGTYSFSHALIAQTLYEELTTPDRVQLHRAVGEALERVYGASSAAHLDELAHHFFQAAPGGEVEKAVQYASAAAERALRLLAFEDAAGHYGRALRALEVAPPVDEVRRCELLLARADAEDRSADTDTSRSSSWEAVEIARRISRADLLAQAALGVGGRAQLGTGENEPLRALLHEALEALPESETALRSRLLSRLVGLPPLSDSLEERRATSERALELAREAGDLPSQIQALIAKAWALPGPDHVEDRIALGTELLELAARPGGKGHSFLNYDPAFAGHEYRYGAFLALGDMTAADREIEAAARLAEELRQPVYSWFVGWLRSSRALSDGRFDEAQRLIEEGLTFVDRAKYPVAEFAYRGQQLWLAMTQGEAEAIRDPLQLMFDNPWTLGPFRPVVTALACHRRGDHGAARRELAELTERGLETLPRNEMWLLGLSSLADLFADYGDATHAAQAYGLLLPYAHLNVIHELLRTHEGSAAGPLGLLAATTGRWEAAWAHFEAALEMNTRMGARPAVVTTQHRYALALAQQDPRANRARVEDLLARARAGADEIGRRISEEEVSRIRDLLS